MKIIRLFTLMSATTFVFATFGVSARADDAPPPDGWQSVMPLLAKADVDAGKKLAQACAMCHSLEKGGGTKMGPDLFNIVDRQRASTEGFPYSNAMKAFHDKKWSYETLDQFLFNPRAAVPGTRMSYPGMKETHKRAELIAFLRTLADKPAALPKVK